MDNTNMTCDEKTIHYTSDSKLVRCINIVNKSTNPTPERATVNSAGFDLRANITKPNENDGYKGLNFEVFVKEDGSSYIILKSMGIVLIPTGLHIELPQGYEAQIRPRSGLALKNGIGILNTPGTIDADYRGDIGVILYNFHKNDFVINHGDRIAQMVINKYEEFNLIQVEKLSETSRGSGGFGHSGVK